MYSLFAALPAESRSFELIMKTSGTIQERLQNKHQRIIKLILYIRSTETMHETFRSVLTQTSIRNSMTRVF